MGTAWSKAVYAIHVLSHISPSRPTTMYTDNQAHMLPGMITAEIRQVSTHARLLVEQGLFPTNDENGVLASKN
jgi:hypothetical protein